MGCEWTRGACQGQRHSVHNARAIPVQGVDASPPPGIPATHVNVSQQVRLVVEPKGVAASRSHLEEDDAGKVKGEAARACEDGPEVADEARRVGWVSSCGAAEVRVRDQGGVHVHGKGAARLTKRMSKIRKAAKTVEKARSIQIVISRRSSWIPA
eukprot:scaffold17337_cov98-Isochrysis_galbana.AAC.1